MLITVPAERHECELLVAKEEDLAQLVTLAEDLLLGLKKPDPDLPVGIRIRAAARSPWPEAPARTSRREAVLDGAAAATPLSGGARGGSCGGAGLR